MDKADKLESFTAGYIDGVLGTVTDDDGEYTDPDIDELSPEALEMIKDDCCKFFDYAFNDLVLFCEKAGEFYDGDVWDWAGYNFFLTRNSHGEGFWSREGVTKELGDRLIKLSDKMGEFSLYMGSDKKLYCQ